MKKRISNIAALAAITFTFALILSGCSKLSGTEESSAGAVEETTEAAKNSGRGRDGNNNDNAETDADEKKELFSEIPEEIKPLHPILRGCAHDDSAKNDDKTKAIEVSYKSSGMKLNDEEAKKYPRLNEALDKNYELNDGQYLVMCEDMRSIAEAMLEDYNPIEDGYIELCNLYTASVVRADNVLFSMNLKNKMVYDGRTEKYYNHSFTYDTESGRLLSLSDIAANAETVKTGIKAELYKKYADYEFDEEILDSEIEALFNGEEAGGSSWSIDYIGLNIIFNEYCITGADGQQSVSLSFNKYPEAVKEACMKAPEDYVKEIIYPESGDMYADINNSGEPVSISITGIPSDDYNYGDIEITLTTADGQSISGRFDAGYFYMDPYYVKHGNRHFLYTFGSYENDYTINTVYEITDGNIREQGAENLYLSSNYSESGYQNDDNLKDSDMYRYYYELYTLTDIENMVFSSKCDALSTYNIERNYTIGENGMPESNKLYRADSDIEPVALKNISALETDAEGNETGADLEIKPGDKLKFYLTDNEGFVIFALEDGKYAKVSVGMHEYPQLINGEDVEEVLDGIGYAG